MNTELTTGEIGGFIHVNKIQSPLFKDEKENNNKLTQTKKFQQESVKSIFEEVARSINNSHLKKEWGTSKESRRLRSSFYFSLSQATGISIKDIQDKIETYVQEHPQKILNLAREISIKTGWSLDNITQKELLDLIHQSSIEVLPSLIGQKPNLKNRHITNFLMAQISSEIFNINISLHDVLIIYDQDFNGGTVQEQLHLKARVSKEARSLNFLQGFAIISSGILSQNLKPNYFHIEPQELLSSI